MFSVFVIITDLSVCDIVQKIGEIDPCKPITLHLITNTDNTTCPKSGRVEAKILNGVVHMLVAVKMMMGPPHQAFCFFLGSAVKYDCLLYTS